MFIFINLYFIISITSIQVGLLPNGAAQTNLDDEILNLENINILFSCLKKLDCNQNYYDLIANCLPDISSGEFKNPLTNFYSFYIFFILFTSFSFFSDFIPDEKLLNKVINEFLINQNNNVEFFAIILHKVNKN